MKRQFLSTILICFIVLAFTGRPRFERLSVEMHTRTSAGGFTANTTTYFYYDISGRLITHMYEPSETILITNAKGELTIYDKVNNEVFQSQSPIFSASNVQIYYFLENKKHDLGLSTMDFKLQDTRFEEGLMITEWTPPMQMAKDILKVELVHQRDNPIYMAYYNIYEKIIKKVYFYNYEDIYGVEVPTSITQIDFQKANDSIITKSVYKNFKIDGEIDSDLFDFKVPANAKKIGR